jgi:hypothetical protein
MSAGTDEQAARARLRALAKATRARARNAERRRIQARRDRERFAAWIKREHAAYDRHAASPADANLRRAWLRVLAQRPALYGKRGAA